ncbi:MAG: carbon monoxide dehydrogenase subunit G [Pseudotabrizicola sp.]|uniref:CoxG family protein n=1 Tax=Pseudotabrizicola sp. TaxID=2939647 RepID=UPI00272F07DC|nr:carbon monoxide dehydrogenase subunit G [Pseudotabrizicola sp.]MDP2082590.1 carbon monoxide dehydrogenase subunit G [Pseudotabrizicola sp.]MDZ7573486.1 carbon monoxide dehydrogenase subunit G [Pseudotabrizicola sp.]
MQMSDTREIKAAPSEVWAAILNPDVLKACIPGCTEVTGNRDDGFEATVTQKVGPVKATFKGAVTLSLITEGAAVTISGEGKGGPAGFAKGGAVVQLEPIPEGTRLSYEVEANVGGKLAQLGSRIIDGFAKKMADEFFNRFQTAVEGPTEPEVLEPDVAAEGNDEGSDGAEGQKKGWFKRLIS